MERVIPSVLEVFDCSPGQRRKFYATPSNDRIVDKKCVETPVSTDRDIDKFFDYLNEEDSATPTNNKNNNKKSSKEEIRHLERHLSMKRTIRKKIMRDLQQAFVEDPKDLQTDPEVLSNHNKNNIDINNLTLSKSGISKSEHNFLDMLKGESGKEKRGLKGLIDFRGKKKVGLEGKKWFEGNDSGALWRKITGRSKR